MEIIPSHAFKQITIPELAVAAIGSGYKITIVVSILLQVILCNYDSTPCTIVYVSLGFKWQDHIWF